MYIITARRMTSGELLKLRKGWFIAAGYESLDSGSSRFSLTVPVWRLPPTLRYIGLEGWPNVDDVQRAKSLAIGESDRFTLLFVKPAS